MLFAVSALAFGQSANQIRLYPRDGKPRGNAVGLTSTEKRVGDVVYQVFHFRGDPNREAFRVDVGFYDKARLVKDWLYGIILERDLNGDSIADYLWYGGDDTGQRLLLFLSKDDHYDCINVFKSVEAAWRKKFGETTPDLGEVFGDKMVNDVTWDRQTQLLIIVVVPNGLGRTNNHKWKLAIPPREFVHAER